MSCSCAGSGAEQFVRDENNVCVCPAGHTGVGTLCEPCPVGTFKAAMGNVQCTGCNTVTSGSTTILNGTIAASNETCVCDAGYFMHSSDGEHELQYCAKIADVLKFPESVDADVDSVDIATLPLAPGFWRVSRDSIDIRQCFSPDACLGGPDPEVSCAEGHTGAYCGVCVDGYSEVGSSITGMRCVECTGRNTHTVVIGAVLLSILLLLPCFYFFYKRRKYDEDEIIDMQEDAAQRASNAHDKLADKKSRVESFVSNVQTPFKILLSYAQIVSGFSFNFSIRFPPVFSGIVSVFSFANLDFVSVTPMGCVMPITYHHQLLGYTLLPLIGFGLLLGLYKFLSVGAKGNPRGNKFRDQVFNAFLLLTFLVLPTTSTKILNTFACDGLDDGTRVLRGDMGIDCDSTVHKFFQIYAGCMILVYPIGIPLMYFVLLRNAKGLLDRGQGELVNTKIVKLVEEVEEATEAASENVGEEVQDLKTVASVSEYVTKQAEIEEAVQAGLVIAEKDWKNSFTPALIEYLARETNVSRVFWHSTGDDSQVLGVEVTLSEAGAKDEALRRRADDEKIHSKLGRMNFLYAAYEPRVWWFEVFETCRRLLLTGGQVLLNPGTPSQILLNLIICVISMRVYSKYRPFVDEKSDELADVAQVQLFFTMLAALCIKVNIDAEDEYNQKTFDVALVVTQCMGPLLLVYQGFVYGGADVAALNSDVGGALGDIREIARSISEAKGEGKELNLSRQLRAVSGGAIELGSSFFKRKVDRWKDDGADDGGRNQKPSAEIEMGTMEANPIHGDSGHKKKVDDNKKTDNRHILRADSGGFGRKVFQESGPKKGARKSTGEGAPAAVKKGDERLDTESGNPYWENVVADKTTTWEEP
jgi:hypothetical protein